jgi:uncharacterized protein YjbI with pentapeptide repeats
MVSELSTDIHFAKIHPTKAILPKSCFAKGILCRRDASPKYHFTETNFAKFYFAEAILPNKYFTKCSPKNYLFYLVILLFVLK